MKNMLFVQNPSEYRLLDSYKVHPSSSQNNQGNKDIGHNILFVFNQKERKQIMDIIHDCLQADDFKYNLKETAL